MSVDVQPFVMCIHFLFCYDRILRTKSTTLLGSNYYIPSQPHNNLLLIAVKEEQEDCNIKNSELEYIIVIAFFKECVFLTRQKIRQRESYGE